MPFPAQKIYLPGILRVSSEKIPCFDAVRCRVGAVLEFSPEHFQIYFAYSLRVKQNEITDYSVYHGRIHQIFDMNIEFSIQEIFDRVCKLFQFSGLFHKSGVEYCSYSFDTVRGNVFCKEFCVWGRESGIECDEMGSGEHKADLNKIRKLKRFTS